MIILSYGATQLSGGEDKKNSIFWRIVGDNPDPQLVAAVNVTDNVTSHYPPTFVWQCKDDKLVHYSASERMAQALEAAGVKYQLRLYEKGGHGIGLADHTDAAGWLEDAVQFWQSVTDTNT